MDKRWKTNKSSVYNIGYHIIWCPKYRRKNINRRNRIQTKGASSIEINGKWMDY